MRTSGGTRLAEGQGALSTNDPNFEERWRAGRETTTFAVTGTY